MCFTYIFRDKTGVKREARIEAASREVAFATLKASGIVPIKLTEVGRESSRSFGKVGGSSVHSTDKNGRVARSTNGLPRNSSFPILHVILVLAVLVTVSTLVWWWVTTDKQDVRSNQPPSTPKRMVVDAPKRTMPENGNSVKANKAKDHQDSHYRPTKPNRVSPDSQPSHTSNIVSVVTNEAGFILTTIEEDGKRKIITESLTPPTFKNPMHQLIAAIVAMDNGSEMAPLPLGPGDDAAMRAALKLPIKDLPTDTEEIKKLKDAVRATRKDIESLMDQGISVSEIFTQHRELWNENIKIRNEMIGEYRRFLTEGDVEAAGQYLEQINRSFREMGIPEIEEADIQPKGKKKRRNTQ